MPDFHWQPQPGEIEFDAIRASGPGGQNVKQF
jgi:ribosome-associated protein